ncbi:hypothetical protein [Kordiimonas sp.]|uniref:hypothetical protein n=1 Tax=Kordiimonas sp. TaxID=1970157 RepID=UPI003B521ECC
MTVKSTAFVISFAVCFCGEEAFAGSSKQHEELEPGSCSDSSPGGGTDADRMIQNAINHAIAWCSDAGGVKEGNKRSDWTARDEDGGQFCRVTGRIECNS